MHSLEEFRQIIENEIQSLSIKKDPEELYEPIRYILSLGGKRIRPALTLMGCEMYIVDYKKAIPAALAIEVFHNFTLVHDDIMDRAPIRRGNATIHQKWNDNIAILAGDTMLPMAYELLMHLDDLVLKKVLRCFNTTARDVCEGQQYDMNFETQDQVRLDDYIEMIRLKTAVLLGTSLEIGSIIGGASEEDQVRLRQFGIHTGIAFQIRDDLLDVFGEQELFGKQNSGDIVTNKKTYLFLKAYEMASPEDRKILDHYFSNIFEDNEEKISRIKEVYYRTGVAEQAELEIRKQIDLAIKEIRGTSADEAGKEELIKLAEKLGSRNY